MGGCLSGPQLLKKIQKVDSYDKTQDESGRQNLSNNALLSFRCIFSNMKLRKCKEMASYSIKVSFGDYQKFEISTKIQEDGIIEWDLQHRFSFQATQLSLKEQFMRLDFSSAELQNAGNIKINLFSLATGPYNQDFAIEKGQDQCPRISFRIQLSQQVCFRFEVKEAQMIPTDKEFPGDIFAFSLNSMVGNKIEESQLSYKYLISMDQFQSSQSISNRVNARKLSRKQTLSQNHVIVSTLAVKKSLSTGGSIQELRIKKQIEDNTHSKKIKWSQCPGKQLPFIQATVPLCLLHSTNFNIVFYSFNLKSRSVSSECFISLNKLLNFEAKEVKEQGTNKLFQQQDINVNLKSWSKGKQVGNARFLLFFKVQKYLKQSQMCVRTQSGVIESVAQPENFHNYGLPGFILQLQKISKDIQNQFMKLPSLKTRQQKKDWIQQLNEKLRKQAQLLQNSSSQQDCRNKQALLQCQRRLFQLGKRVLQLLDEGIEQIQQNCWTILTKLINREELSLSRMSFQNYEIEICLASLQNQYLAKKKEACKQYYKLMAELLQRTLQSHQFYSSRVQRQFTQLFFPYAYFRMPQFRNLFLANIARDSDQEHFQSCKDIFEGDKSKSSLQQSRLTLELDWQSKFHKALKNEQDIVKLEGKLDQMMKTSSWFQRLQKREKVFFSFLRFWINYIQKQWQSSSSEISWNYVPGYNKILTAFLSQSKAKSIQSYSDEMKLAWISFTCNPELLNTFITILYRKTNQYNTHQLEDTYELISLCFSRLTLKKKVLPDDFDWMFFLKGMEIVLEGDNKAGIIKILSLLYEHFRLFSNSFKNKLATYLLGNVFCRLFLHWSFYVRVMFHQLMIAKIYCSHLQKDEEKQQTETSQLLKRFDLLLETLIRFRNQKLKTQNQNSQKQLYITLQDKIKKIKQKSIENSQIKGPILLVKGQQPYLALALQQYSKIKEIFTNLEPTKDINDIPAISIKQALDERQIRPE